MSLRKQDQDDTGFIQISLDINSSSQSQGAARGNKNTGKIEEKDVGAEGLKTPNQKKRHKKWTETEAEVARRREGKRKRKKLEKEQQPGEIMERGEEKRWEIGSEKEWESGMEKESTSGTVAMQSEGEDICRTPTIDLHEVWSMDEDGDLADVGKVAVLTARFLKLLREVRDKFNDLKL